MGDSLRDQLLNSGLVKPSQKAKPPRRKPSGANKGGANKGGAGKGSSRHRGDKPATGNNGEMNLAQAWAARARVESSERKQAKAEAEAKARARKELLERLRKALDGNTLNKPDADQVRHFEYGGKIRRVHVDAAQLEALNAGQLAVVQVKGSYALVTFELAREIQAFAPGHMALLVDPDAAATDDGVPDNLMW